jgi:hypothetical protein
MGAGTRNINSSQVLHTGHVSLQKLLLEYLGLLDTEKYEENEFQLFQSHLSCLVDSNRISQNTDIVENLFATRQVSFTCFLKQPVLMQKFPELYLLQKTHKEIFLHLLSHFPNKIIFTMFRKLSPQPTPDDIDHWLSQNLKLYPAELENALGQTKEDILRQLSSQISKTRVTEVLDSFTGEYEVPNTVIKGHDAIPFQMDTKFIFVRDCYLDMYQYILVQGSVGPVLICGDPGIGKSYFGLYVFCRMTMGKNNTLRKVIRYTMSGDWIEFDGKNFDVGHSWDNSRWRDEETWLLLDSQEQVPMLGKKCRVVLFASPQKHNYHSFIKQKSAVCFYMPEWTKKEVRKFLSFVDTSYLVELVERDRDGATAKQVPKVPEEESELDAYKNAALKVVLKRYRIIGGRIRDLLATGVSTKALKRSLMLAVQNLDFGSFQSIIGVEVQRGFPSIVYKIMPCPKNPSAYVTGMCSKYCMGLVPYVMLRKQKQKASELYSLFSRLTQTRAIAGVLFEAICHQKLEEGATFSRRKFECDVFDNSFAIAESENVVPESLVLVSDLTMNGCSSDEYSDSEEEKAEPSNYHETTQQPVPDDAPNYRREEVLYAQASGDIAVVSFDSKDTMWVRIKEAYAQAKGKNKQLLVLPNFPSQGHFDSFVFDIGTKSVDFFQVTIADIHKIDLPRLKKWIRNLARIFQTPNIQVHFSFMVPAPFYALFSMKNLQVRSEATEKFHTDRKKNSLEIKRFINSFKSMIPISLWVVEVDASHFGDSSWYSTTG